MAAVPSGRVPWARRWPYSHCSEQRKLGSGEYRESLGVARPYNGGISAVEGGDIFRPEPLSDSDRCRADDTEAKIGVSINRFGHAEKVFPVDRVAGKRCFGQVVRWPIGYGANDDVRARSGGDAVENGGLQRSLAKGGEQVKLLF